MFSFDEIIRKCWLDGDETANTETEIVEVELVSASSTNWFIFEIELDEQTTMAQVAEAAEAIQKLPKFPKMFYDSPLWTFS